jgi:hypothetical protein
MFTANPKMTEDKIVNDLKNLFGKEFTYADVKGYCRSHGVSESTVMKRIGKFRVGKGRYNLELKVREVVEKIEKAYEAAPAPAVNLVPGKDDRFVSFGNFPTLKKIIKSGIFYPSFITGLSGNGKTFGVEQACAQLNRELVRVNITIETDEDDLIGGFRLVNGDTVWHNGPVIEALQRGAILLLDEIDLASNKILCLQSILEGKGVFLKKIGKYVEPAAGFNVIATANTKGKGSDDGRFIGTNVLNEAFLERFALTFEQEYPSAATETNILKKLCSDDKFCARLADWADIIRKTFYDGGIDEIISTRRLVHIIQAYKIFGDKVKAIQLCLNRFDDETKQAFLDLYDKVDNEVDITEEEVL